MQAILHPGRKRWQILTAPAHLRGERYGQGIIRAGTALQQLSPGQTARPINCGAIPEDLLESELLGMRGGPLRRHCPAPGAF